MIRRNGMTLDSDDMFLIDPSINELIRSASEFVFFFDCVSLWLNITVGNQSYVGNLILWCPVRYNIFVKMLKHSSNDDHKGCLSLVVILYQ